MIVSFVQTSARWGRLAAHLEREWSTTWTCACAGAADLASAPFIDAGTRPAIVVSSPAQEHPRRRGGMGSTRKSPSRSRA